MFLTAGKKKSRQRILKGIFQENQQLFYPRKVRYKKVGMGRFVQLSVLTIIGILAIFMGSIFAVDAPKYLYDSALNKTNDIGLAVGLIDQERDMGTRQYLTNNRINKMLPLKTQDIPYLFPLKNNNDYQDTFLLEKPSAIDQSNIHDNWLRQHGDYFSNNAMPLSDIFGLDIKTIVIDPGHGGKDPGTSGKMGLQEKGIVLDIALRLKKRLEASYQIKVSLTRDKDEFFTLNERIKFANDKKADLFISLHVNYLPSKPNNIIETYYYGIPNDDSSLALAIHENNQSNVSLSEFTAMVEKISGTIKLQESERLALDIQKSLYSNMGENDKTVLDMGIKQAPFLVIMGTDMPGVLAEVTCLSNEQEEMKLHNPDYRESIAGYLEAGVINYLYKGEIFYVASR